MVVEKMFWDAWRNVTSGTSGWSFGGNNSNKGPPTSSKSAQRTRYNRLKSSGYGGAPTKSISQPANLTGLCSNSSNIYSSTESLEETDELGFAAGSSSSTSEGCKGPSLSSSNIAPKGNSTSISGRKWPSGNSSSMKHSISSFFPFISCTSSTTSSGDNSTNAGNKTTLPSSLSSLSPSSKNSQENSQNPCSEVFSTSTSFTLKDQQMKESSNKGIGGSPDFGTAGDFTKSSLGTASGNERNSTIMKPANEDDDHEMDKGESSTSGQFKSKKESPPSVNADLICEDEISDLDDDVEHLTCDVCDRAFPTLKQLAAHQRKKRHYGCLQCDSIFPSREVLEFHREQMSHYDYVIDVYEEGDEAEFYESDDENGLREADDDEERERLL